MRGAFEIAAVSGVRSRSPPVFPNDNLSRQRHLSMTIWNQKLLDTLSSA